MPFKKWLRRVALFPLMVFMGGIPEGDGAAAPTAAETEARAKGWRPQEEFSGDATKWVDHEEFLKRSDLYHQIGKMNKTIKKMDEALNATVKYTKAQTEAAYQRGLQEAHGRLDAAVEAKDIAAVREINKEIVQLEQQKPVATAETTLPEEVQEFQDRNASWFDKDPKMTRVAIALAQQFAEEHPRMSLTKRLEMVDAEMAEMFPTKFAARREAASPVEGAGQPGERGGGKTKYAMSKLNAEERTVHDQYVRRGVMKSEDYFKSLEEIEPGRFGK